MPNLAAIMQLHIWLACSIAWLCVSKCSYYFAHKPEHGCLQFEWNDSVNMNRCWFFFFTSIVTSHSVWCLKCTTVSRTKKTNRTKQKQFNAERCTYHIYTELHTNLYEKKTNTIRLDHCFIRVSCNCRLLSDEHEWKKRWANDFFIHLDGWKTKEVSMTRAM